VRKAGEKWNFLKHGRSEWMVAKAKASYKITNWRQSNESLVQRGSITFWFRDDVIDNSDGTRIASAVNNLILRIDRPKESCLDYTESEALLGPAGSD
jgi:hypothetical protein